MADTPFTAEFDGITSGMNIIRAHHVLSFTDTPIMLVNIFNANKQLRP